MNFVRAMHDSVLKFSMKKVIPSQVIKPSNDSFGIQKGPILFESAMLSLLGGLKNKHSNRSEVGLPGGVIVPREQD